VRLVLILPSYENSMHALFLAAILLFIVPVSTALSATESFYAGITRISVPTDVPFDMLVWYPTQAEEVPWQADPFTIPASHDAAIATGNFPIVLLSHGGGATGGSPLLLCDLSAYLARQGFIVVAPFHGKTGLTVRPLQVVRALDALLANPRFKTHSEPMRLGMLGFSLGGAVTLELAGAIPNAAHLASYCSTHPDDIMSCRPAPGRDGGNGSASRQSPSAENAPPPSRLPLKAIVLLDPFAVLFQHDELAAVTMPVLLFRPDQSALPGEGNAFGLAVTLPHPPQYQTVPGGHFIFADVCAPFLQSSAPEVCLDPPGVDRAAIHIGLKEQIAKFFHDNL
jgi:predicted dienelactone hydrolase